MDPNWSYTDIYGETDRFMHKLTFHTHRSLFQGFDPELLDFVPRPLAAVIFLYPITEKSEEFRHEEEARVTKREQDISPQVMFFKQTISNACGMMALIHSLANNKELLGMSFTHNTHHEIDKHVMCMSRSRFVPGFDQQG